jgi:hypothetical protein
MHVPQLTYRHTCEYIQIHIHDIIHTHTNTHTAFDDKCLEEEEEEEENEEETETAARGSASPHQSEGSQVDGNSARKARKRGAPGESCTDASDAAPGHKRPRGLATVALSAKNRGSDTRLGDAGQKSHAQRLAAGASKSATSGKRSNVSSRRGSAGEGEEEHLVDMYAHVDGGGESDGDESSGDGEATAEVETFAGKLQGSMGKRGVAQRKLSSKGGKADASVEGSNCDGAESDERMRYVEAQGEGKTGGRRVSRRASLISSTYSSTHAIGKQAHKSAKKNAWSCDNTRAQQAARKIREAGMPRGV